MSGFTSKQIAPRHCCHAFIESAATGLPANIFVSNNPDPAAGFREAYDAIAQAPVNVGVWNGLANQITPEEQVLWDRLGGSFSDNHRNGVRVAGPNYVPMPEYWDEYVLKNAACIKDGLRDLFHTASIPVPEASLALLETTLLQAPMAWPATTFRGPDITVGTNHGRSLQSKPRYHLDGMYTRGVQQAADGTAKNYRVRLLSALGGRGLMVADHEQVTLVPMQKRVELEDNFLKKKGPLVRDEDLWLFTTETPDLWELKPFAFAMITSWELPHNAAVHATPFAFKPNLPKGRVYFEGFVWPRVATVEL